MAYALNDLGRAYSMAGGRFAEAEERLDEARALWEELDNRPMLGDNLGMSSQMRLLVGDHAGAMSEARSTPRNHPGQARSAGSRTSDPANDPGAARKRRRTDA
jgi:hypothetical protein